MALLVLSSWLTFIRRLYQDTSSTDPGITDVILTDLLNDVYHRALSVVDRRPQINAALFPSVTIGTLTSTSTAKNILEILAVHRGATYAQGARLEIMPVYKIIYLQQTDITQAAPTRISLERAGVGSESAAGGTVGAWTARFHPIPDATYTISGLVLNEPVTLASGGSADTPDISEEDQRLVGRMCAVEAARLLRRPPDFIQQLMDTIPERYQAVIRRRPEPVDTVSRVEAGT